MVRKVAYFATQLAAIIYAFLVPEGAVAAVIIVWLSILFYVIRNVDKHFPLLSFLLSFFTFLLVGFVLETDQTITPRLLFQSHALIISLFFVYNGYVFTESKSTTMSFQNSASLITHKSQNIYYSKVRRLSKFLVYLCSVFALMEVVEQIVFFKAYSYIELYSDYRGEMPYIVYKLSNLFTLAAYMYYATLPSKSESKYVNILFVLIPLLYLFTGRRGIAILPLLLYVTYCFIRNHITPNEKWIGRGGKLTLLIASPFFIALLFVMSQYRQGESVTGLNTGESITEFFVQTGSSIDILGMTYDLRDQLPEHHAFLLGPLYDVFYGSDLHYLFGKSSLSRNTAEFAMSGNSLGSFLAYNFITSRYLEGAGVGSSYIAEAYADLSWFGIIIISFLYGIILCKIPRWFNRNLILSIVSFFILFGLYKAPRSQAFSFVADLLGPTNILIILIIHLWAKRQTPKI